MTLDAPDDEFAARRGARDEALDAAPVTRIARPINPLAWQDAERGLGEGLCASQEIFPLVDARGVLQGAWDDAAILGRDDGQGPALISLPTLPLSATVGEARRRFVASGESRAEGVLRWIALLEHDGRYSGWCASRDALRALVSSRLPDLPRMGGMATPLGVYLSTGRYHGGAPWPGMALNGALLALGAAAAQGAFMALFALGHAFIPSLGGLRFEWLVWAQSLFVMLALLAMMRMTPLAGLHAAEHMTLHALENRLPLTHQTVRLQSRVHPRCGTHLTVLLAGAALGWMTLEAAHPYLNSAGRFTLLLGWLVLMLRYWRAAGAWLQDRFTTREPTDAQLSSAMAAARQVLDQCRARPHPASTPFWRRFWSSGLVQTLAGFFVVQWLLERWIGF